jgi:hypothetical protein
MCVDWFMADTKKTKFTKEKLIIQTQILRTYSISQGDCVGSSNGS